MNVRELIEKLQELPESSEVILSEEDNGDHMTVVDVQKEDFNGRFKAVIYASY